MWYKRSHLLQPLTALTSTKLTIKWTDVKQQVLDKTKQIVAGDTLLIYPDFNERFGIYTDACDFQFRAVISQSGKPIAFYIPAWASGPSKIPYSFHILGITGSGPRFRKPENVRKGR